MKKDGFRTRQMIFVDDPIDFEQDTNQSTGAQRWEIETFEGL